MNRDSRRSITILAASIHVAYTQKRQQHRRNGRRNKKRIYFYHLLTWHEKPRAMRSWVHILNRAQALLTSMRNALLYCIRAVSTVEMLFYKYILYIRLSCYVVFLFHLASRLWRSGSFGSVYSQIANAAHFDGYIVYSCVLWWYDNQHRVFNSDNVFVKRFSSISFSSILSLFHSFVSR